MRFPCSQITDRSGGHRLAHSFQRLLAPAILSLAGLVNSSALVTYDQATHPEYYDRFSSSNPLVNNTNPNFVGLGYDWSGVAWQNNTKSFALLSPQHILVANHYAPGVGETITFQAADGAIYNTTVAASTQIKDDINIVTLATPVPATVEIQSYGALDLLDYPSQSPAAYVGQDLLIYGFYSKVAKSSVSGIFIDSTNSQLQFLNSADALGEGYLETGDSGSPSFIPWLNPVTGEKTLTVIGEHHGIAESGGIYYGIDGFLADPSITGTMNSLLASTGYALRWDASFDQVWTGDGSGSGFGTGGNWSASSVPASWSTLAFNGADANGKYSINLAADRAVNGLYFYSAAGDNGFTFSSGTTLSLARVGIFNYDDSLQTFDNNFFFNFAPTFDGGVGGLRLNGTLANNGNLLYLTGTGTNVLSGHLTGTGGLAKDGTGILQITTDQTYTGKTFVHNGRLQLNDADLSSRVVLDNAAGAVLELQTDATVRNIEGGGVAGGNVELGAHQLTVGADNTAAIYAGSISGTGTLQKTGSASLTLNGSLASTLSVQVGQGTVALGGTTHTLNQVGITSGTLLQASGILTATVTNQGSIQNTGGTALILQGSLKGSGSYTGDMQIGGTFEPGNSPAQVTFNGDLDLLSSAHLKMEIGGLIAGSGFDQIVVNGALLLDGALEISLINGFVVSWGDSFELFSFNSIGGDFSAFSLPSLTGGLYWNTGDLSSEGIISVIPEPALASWGLLGGLAWLLARRRTA